MIKRCAWIAVALFVAPAFADNLNRAIENEVFTMHACGHDEQLRGQFTNLRSEISKLSP